MTPLGAGTLMEIRKEAAAWLVEMDAAPKQWSRKRFTAWLKSSPQHMDEFLAQSVLWGALRDLDPNGIDLGDLPKGPDNVIDWPETPRARSHGIRSWFRWWFVGLAAALLLIVSATFLALRVNRTEVATTIGEQRAVRLDDGSVVHLNTDTRIRIHFTADAREIQLLQGEALFTVKRDVDRPFQVQSDDIRLEALGTQFNVRRRNADTLVAVVEGRVAVVDTSRTAAAEPQQILAANNKQGDTLTGPIGIESQQKMRTSPAVPPHTPYEAGRAAPAGALAVLGAGQQASISIDGTVDRQPTQSITAATAWRQRQLVFSNTPLIEVATEVARYNATPRLQIEGQTLQQRRLNGVFAADDPESLLQFLALDPTLSVRRSGNVAIIRIRDAEPASTPSLQDDQ